MPSLIVRDSKNGRVKEIQLTKRRFTIGSSDYNDLVLTRDGVAKEHCVLVEKDGAFFLRDLTRKKEKALVDGARFDVASFEVQFRGERQRSTSAKPAASKDSRSSVAPRESKSRGRSKDAAPTDPLIRTLREVAIPTFSAALLLFSIPNRAAADTNTIPPPSNARIRM